MPTDEIMFLPSVEKIKELEEENKKLVKDNKKYKEVINKIKNICDKVPYDWSVCGIEVVNKIERALKEVEHD